MNKAQYENDNNLHWDVFENEISQVLVNESNKSFQCKLQDYFNAL